MLLPPLQDDWLEVPAQVLPMWQATPLAPFGGPKALLHCLVSPELQLAQAQQLVKVRSQQWYCATAAVAARGRCCCCHSQCHPPRLSSAVRAFVCSLTVRLCWLFCAGCADCASCCTLIGTVCTAH